MKFTSISDTHGQHEKLKLPKGDVIIHAGDISSRGHKNEVVDFLNWFKGLDFKYKLFIAGNHDFFFERESEESIQSLIPPGIIYLNDNSVNIEGITIWGSPISPWFYDWAFNRRRGNEIKKHWDLIPKETQILITHGPAFNILDKTIYGENVGCEDLLSKIKEIKPKFHLCGHIHEAYGTYETSETSFINASILNERYQLKNLPVTFEY